ncbi:DNA alkylation repair protein [Candidatus Endomicrobiellum devescovinae]|jgi:3-methyladenine DNA glycosylase AlkD|uniref:DNA alkylation repair protein n=1 Tax=Candidatus Endomicrobiellum devescovinae TaxID=3242322 RepID=UPI002822F38D|nr:DNA alkylation repair protein [Endomicrobium sp.]
MKINSSKNIKDLLLKDLKKYAEPAFAKFTRKILNICKDRYAQDDILLGVRVPKQRTLAKKYANLINFKETEKLLQDKIHELRFIALVILSKEYKRADNKLKSKIAKIYLRNYKYINNWDLVDTSAPNIPGHYWYNNELDKFWEFAKSGSLWKERISMIATFYFIRQNRFNETLKLAEVFLNHKHDLMHKASGWMLREIGKRDKKVLLSFLDKHASIMPRTMLRYSTEKLSKQEKKFYLKESSRNS